MAKEDIVRLEKFIHRVALSIAGDFHEVRKSITDLSTKIDVRFDVVEQKIERMDRRLDDQIEARHKLGDRLSIVERKLKM